MTDRNLAPVAALIGDPTRIAMLTGLADGRALPAGDLARLAGVHPATATAHLRKLIDGGLITVTRQGRHRYHQLAGPQVSAVLEALAQLAPAVPVRSLNTDRAARRVAEARTCYDHLAGRRGVQLRDRLIEAGALHLTTEPDHDLTAAGDALLRQLRIDPDELRSTRRIFARSCVDWTQRRPHLAGALPAAITSRLLELGWLHRGTGRGLRVAADYDERLNTWFDAIVA